MRLLAQRRATDLIPVGLVVLAVVLVVLALSGSGGEPPPATGAAAVVPGDALLYVHLSTDPSRPAVHRARQLSTHFPDYPLVASAVTTRLSTIMGGGTPLDYSTQIRPWLGKEAAFALLYTPGASAASLIVLDVSHLAQARRVLAGQGAQPAGRYRAVQLYGYPTGTDLAFVRHYLVVGTGAGVRAAIDASSGGRRSLQNTPAYQHAAAGEPADRVLDAYASAAGITRVLASRRGALGVLGGLLSEPSLTGSTVSMSAVPGGARLLLHSALNPYLAPVPGDFNPSLASLLPSGSMLLLDVQGLDRLAPTILGAGAKLGIGARTGPLLARLGAALTAEGVDVKGVTSIFDGESAVAIGPASAPTLIIAARTKDPVDADAKLAALEGPLSQLFPTPSNGPGQAPVIGDQQVGGVTVHQVTLAPGLQLAYAVFRGLVVVSTGLRGIADVIQRDGSLVGDRLYKTTLASHPGQVTSLLFLDFSQLLNLDKQTGLTRGSSLNGLRPDLQKVRAAGLSSARGESDTTAELFLKIS